MDGEWKQHLEQVDEALFRINRHGAMKADAMLVTDAAHLAANSDDRSPGQLVNTAMLPGVVGEAWAMADWHFGYGRNNVRASVDAIMEDRIPPEVDIEEPLSIVLAAHEPGVDTCVGEIDQRMTDYVARLLELPWDEARRLAEDKVRVSRTRLPWKIAIFTPNNIAFFKTLLKNF